MWWRQARQLGVHMMESGESISTIPAEFLIDKGLLVKKVHYASGLNDRLDMKILKAFATDGTELISSLHSPHRHGSPRIFRPMVLWITPV